MSEFTELDFEEAKRAVRLELARVIERGIGADIGAYAVSEAAPYIIDVLADVADEGWPDAPAAPRGTADWLRAWAERLR